MFLWARLTTLIAELRYSENGKKEFANASDYLEIWDDSDSITAVNAQNDLRHPAK